MPFTRTLTQTSPMMRGADVVAVQARLLELGFDEAGRADGLYGGDSASAARAFQRSANLPVTGAVDQVIWTALFRAADPGEEPDGGDTLLAGLTDNHSIFGSVQWRLADDGLRVSNRRPENTGGRPVTVGRVWGAFGPSIARWGAHYQVPVELIIATACTETRGDPEKIRREPGFISDEQTPHRISPGLMQTLISTARDALEGQTTATIDRAWLLVPDNSIRAGTAYISQQKRKTAYDPPKVACAYNAGSIVRNDGQHNRWKMRQFPIGTSEHADRFVKWFNDALRLFQEIEDPPENSFWRALNPGS